MGNLKTAVYKQKHLKIWAIFIPNYGHTEYDSIKSN